MVAPVFQREGARIGGLTTDGISMVARTDSNGQRLYLDVYTDSNRQLLAASSSAGTLNAGNNYCATVRVTGLQAGRKYWWRARADDGSGGTTNGDATTYSEGAFQTLPTGGSVRVAFGACDPMNPTTGYNIIKSPQMWQQLQAMRPNLFISLGDWYYSDIGTDNATADYTSGAWRNPANDAAATVAAYRTNIISALDEFNRRGVQNHKADFFRTTPLAVMWDDHDRGWDDMSGSGTWTAGQITRAANALQAGHEMFFTLNKPLIELDGRTFTPGTSTADYWCQDIADARIIVINCRQFRDLASSADSSSKTMLGATQKAWLLDKIRTNPQRFLILASPLMLDGYHGWNESTSDGWVKTAYERDEILDYIRANGTPSRTLIVSGDTHAGAAMVHRVTPGTRDMLTDIWEVTAGNLWSDSGHGYINGFRAGATGRGAELIKMRVNEPNALQIDLSTGRMSVRLVELMNGRAVWSRVYQ